MDDLETELMTLDGIKKMLANYFADPSCGSQRLYSAGAMLQQMARRVYIEAGRLEGVRKAAKGGE